MIQVRESLPSGSVAPPLPLESVRLVRPRPPGGVPAPASQPTTDGLAVPPVRIPELLFQIPLFTRNDITVHSQNGHRQPGEGPGIAREQGGTHIGQG